MNKKEIEEHRRMLIELNKELQQENKHLNLQLDQALKDYEELLIKKDKAIEYIKQYGNLYCLKHTQFKKYKQYEELLEILGDKEIKEIPQFKGTLEQLDNLTILGDKE